MVPDANALQAFNAPGARTWAATAEALGMGFSHLHSIKVLSIIAGGILGLILVLIPRYIPRTGKWLPTPIGFGLLTCDSIEQAIERAGSKGGNKGVEAAAAMLETIRVLEQL